MSLKFEAPFLLSDSGSTRATAYTFGNKSLTLKEKTHVVWLDSISKVQTRSFDHTRQAWGETHTIGLGCDNHATPCITSDAEGLVHLAYGPHGTYGDWNQSRIKHMVSKESGAMNAFHQEHDFGYSATYACLINSRSNTDCLLYRGGERPYSLYFHKQREQGGWTHAKELFCQRIDPQYTQYSGKIISPAADTLVVAGHYYNAETDKRARGVIAIKSEDLGDTWTHLNGDSLDLPLEFDIERCVGPCKNYDAQGRDTHLIGMDWDLDGGIWAFLNNGYEFSLSRWDGKAWESFEMKPYLPDECSIGNEGNFVIDERGEIHAVISASRSEPDSNWGHPTSEIYYLHSGNQGKSFSCERISDGDPETANWLPTISQNSPHLRVDKPTILYTKGYVGQGCKSVQDTEVYAVLPELST